MSPKSAHTQVLRASRNIYDFCIKLAMSRKRMPVQVLKRSEKPMFLNRDENAAPAMLLEATNKPVLARERQAR